MICDYDKMNLLDQNDFKCVGIDQICDGHSDCNDGNDETYMQCYIKHKHTCQNEQFACPADRVCLNGTQVCDGELDCMIDSGFTSLDMYLGVEDYHSDEDRTYCSNVHQCHNDTQLCPNQWQCLLNEKWGDGNIDCYEAEGISTSDEDQENCPEDYHKCSDGSCITNNWVCDGESDCQGGDDESNCTSCNGQAFFCGLESGKCLDIADVCDGFADCDEKTDEHDDCGADYSLVCGILLPNLF